MKKLVFIMPLMAVSLLASCGGSNPEPTPETTYTITFKNDGDEDKKIENIKAGSIITENIPTPITPKPDSTFIGWCTDTESKNVFDFSKIKIYQDYTLYSGWESAYHIITLDAGEGAFNGVSSIAFEVPTNEKLLPYIKSCVFPTAEDKTFAYYEYEGKDNAIDYDDVVTSDITLKANYFASSTEPTDDLTSFDWKTIKKISVTGDPSLWFNIGATKTVEIKDKYYDVRIIDFAHEGDITANGDQIGITFEFEDAIEKDSDSYAVVWDSSYKSYDYRDSTVNAMLNDIENDSSVINIIPDDLKEVIKPVDKKVGVSINKDNRYEALSFEKDKCPKLFLLAHDEIVDYIQGYVTPGEGTKYQYYIIHQEESERKKSVKCWLRSPYLSNSSNDTVWGIKTGGNLQDEVIYDKSFVAPAFCI